MRVESRELVEGCPAGVLKTFDAFLDAFGLHNSALYRGLLRSDVARENRRAFSPQGIHNDLIDWGRFVRVPDYIFDSNAPVFDAVVALLNLFDDIKPFAHYAIRKERQKLEYLYDMDPAPLFNFDEAGTELAGALFSGFDEREGIGALYEALSRDFVSLLVAIKGDSLFGRDTGAYFSILKHWAHLTYQELESLADPSELISPGNLLGYIQVLKKLLPQLYDRYLCDGMAELRRSRIRFALDKGLSLYMRMCVLELLDGGYGIGEYRLGFSQAAKLMSDEVSGVVRSRFNEAFEHWTRERLAGLRELASYRLIEPALTDRPGSPDSQGASSVFLRYRFYREKFVYLGDLYGDCTANKHSKQLTPELTNIHWTVYAWLLNPYYRVLEVCSPKGDPLVKAHVTPLLIHDRKILMVDAVESVTKMRSELRGVPNKDFDRDFFDTHNEEIFELLVERCVSLGRRVNAEAVYADLYSNSTWVNRALSRFPTDGYHISEVEQTFGGDRIADNVRLLRASVGLPGAIENARVEIQAVNCSLMEQYTLRNHKEVAVLAGLRDDWRLGLRGI